MCASREVHEEGCVANVHMHGAQLHKSVGCVQPLSNCMFTALMVRMFLKLGSRAASFTGSCTYQARNVLGTWKAVV